MLTHLSITSESNSLAAHNNNGRSVTRQQHKFPTDETGSGADKSTSHDEAGGGGGRGGIPVNLAEARLHCDQTCLI